MINTNTDKPTQKPTATISESSIYLKKSELPQNVSSFKNDAGYISSSALSTWLKEHAYISKTEITSLINKANLVVVDTVNKSADSEAINRLNQEIKGIKGEIGAIKDILENINSTYVSTERIKSLATKTDISNLSDEIDEISTSLSNIDLSNIATKDEIPILDGYAKEDWVRRQGYLKTHQSLVGYAKKSDLPTDYIKESDLSEYVKVSEISSTLNDYAKKSSLSEYVKTSTFNNKLNSLATKTDINGYATQEWVNEQGFLTESQDLSGFATKTELKDYVKLTSLNNYAKKSEIPDVSEFVKKDEILLDDYASKKWVMSQNYLKVHQSLAAYAKKSDIPTLNGYATQEWVNEQGFLTESQDLSGFATKTELKDYVKTTSLSNTLNNYAKKNTVYTKDESDFKFLSKIDASDIYLTKTSADNQFASKEMVKREYLRIEDYRGLKAAIVINDEYKDKSLKDLKGDLNGLINGFYIVNYTDVVIVKDHTIANIFKDGAPQAVIKWKEE